MINELIETKKELANNWKMRMDYYQKIIDEVNPYELTEFLNANCSMNFVKGMYMALTREIQDLEELKTEYKKVLSDTSDTILNNFLGVDRDE